MAMARSFEAMTELPGTGISYLADFLCLKCLKFLLIATITTSRYNRVTYSYEYLVLFAGVKAFQNNKVNTLSNNFGLQNSLQIFLVSLNEEPLYLDNLTGRL